jgi:hypothetical protein
MRLDSVCAPKEEDWRKAIARALGVWKKKIRTVGAKTLLHKREEFSYLVISTIVMHNMTVKEREQNCEVEVLDCYKVMKTS